MSIDRRMLAMAAGVSGENPEKFDNRAFYLGAVGLRNDGVIVTAKNVAATDVVPTHHAEARVIRKLTPNSTIWVARVSRLNGTWTTSRPCSGCQKRMKVAGVKKVIYTIGPDEWGTIQLND